MDLDTISQSNASDFKLGDWWVRPQRNELEREQETAHVEARSMQVLVCLGRHAPAVVSKARLLEEVWSDSPFIGDDVISHAIWELRKALGDSAREPVYIQTVARKGYRLVQEILRPQGSPVPIEGAQIDHYDLGQELGRGAMGVVYEAVDRRLGRSVAIKFLAPELTRDLKANQRFQREARLAASLDHPNLGTVHEVGETSQGHRYLVNAYYSGGSLKDRLAEGPLEVAEALRLVRQLVAGLGAAHQRDIIHRDIKPANLLLDEHGTLKICDFGIAKLLGATDLTHTGATLGTPAYKSPEQTQGRDVDHRTDLWSAGVVLCELLSGRRPFDGEEHAVVHSILSQPPRILEDAQGQPLPEAVRDLVARTLAKDPAERFQTAEEMTVALDTVGEGSPAFRPSIASLEEDEEVPKPRFGGSWPWKRMAAVVFIAILVFLALNWIRDARSRHDKQGPPEEEPWPALLAQGRVQWLDGNHRANQTEVGGYFEQAVERMPSSAVAKGHLAVFLVESSTFDETRENDRARARQLISEALALDPQASLALAAQAWLLLLDGKSVEGEQLAREAIDIEPECAWAEMCDWAYVWLAEALWMQQRKEEAFAVLEKGVDVGGGYIRCRLKRAQLYAKSGKMREAESEYLEVLKLDKEQTTALQALSNAYLTARRADEALRYLDPLYKKTGDPKALSGIGYAQYLRRLFPEAIETYRTVHNAYQDTGTVIPTPLMAIGDAYLELGKKTEAQIHYRQALVLFDALKQPGITRQAQRAVCLAKIDRLDEAEAEIQRILHLEREDDSPDLLVYAARIYALKGDREVLLDLARRYSKMKQGSSRFLDDDPAFISYRRDREYLQILEPQLIPIE